MILLAGITLAVVIVALLRRGLSNEEIVSRLSRQTDPRIVAMAAKLLSARGMRLTADVLEQRAKSLAAAGKGAEAAVSGGAGATLSSPFMAASDRAWTDFVRVLAVQDPTARSPGGRIGRFDMHLRRLAEIGWVRGLRRGADGNLEATWVEPMTEARFLGDSWVQYRALVATLKQARLALVDRGVAVATGDASNNTASSISLSGVLALAYRLGADGAVKWMRSPTERARQRIATALFKSANGLF